MGIKKAEGKYGMGSKTQFFAFCTVHAQISKAVIWLVIWHWSGKHPFGKFCIVLARKTQENNWGGWLKKQPNLPTERQTGQPIFQLKNPSKALFYIEFKTFRGY